MKKKRISIWLQGEAKDYLEKATVYFQHNDRGSLLNFRFSGVKSIVSFLLLFDMFLKEKWKS